MIIPQTFEYINELFAIINTDCHSLEDVTAFCKILSDLYNQLELSEDQQTVKSYIETKLQQYIKNPPTSLPRAYTDTLVAQAQPGGYLSFCDFTVDFFVTMEAAVLQIKISVLYLNTLTQTISDHSLMADIFIIQGYCRNLERNCGIASDTDLSVYFNSQVTCEELFYCAQGEPSLIEIYAHLKNSLYYLEAISRYISFQAPNSELDAIKQQYLPIEKLRNLLITLEIFMAQTPPPPSPSASTTTAASPTTIVSQAQLLANSWEAMMAMTPPPETEFPPLQYIEPSNEDELDLDLDLDLALGPSYYDTYLAS